MWGEWITYSAIYNNYYYYQFSKMLVFPIVLSVQPRQSTVINLLYFCYKLCMCPPFLSTLKQPIREDKTFSSLTSLLLGLCFSFTYSAFLRYKCICMHYGCITAKNSSNFLVYKKSRSISIPLGREMLA